MSSRVALALPFVAVLAGLYVLGSAWAAILIYHAGIAIFLLLGRRPRPGPPLLKGWNAPAGLALSLLCACGGPLLVILWPIVALERPGFSATMASFGLCGVRWYLFAAYYSTVHPLLEEMFWRGRLASKSRSVTIDDLAFAGYHMFVLYYFVKVPWLAAVFAILLFISWLWRRIVDRRGGLAVPLITHTLADISIMAAAFFLARG